MWIYEKRLEFPVNIKEPNAKMAMFRRLESVWKSRNGLPCVSQRYSMPYKECKAVLTDVARELAHLEIVAAIVLRLRNLAV